MGDVTPIHKKRGLATAHRIAELPIIDEVDEMLRDEVPAVDVARYIQGTFELLTDFAERTIAEHLRERRKNMLPPVDPEGWPATCSSENLEEPRPPGRIASQQYRKASKGIDLLLEAESLYLAQRDRLDRLMHLESEAGEPYEEMPKEFGRAESLLMSHAKLQEQFGPVMNRMRVSLEIEGGADSRLGQRVSAVMADPESRHKVLSMFKRLTQAASIPAVIDAEAEPVGGS